MVPVSRGAVFATLLALGFGVLHDAILLLNMYAIKRYELFILGSSFAMSSVIFVLWGIRHLKADALGYVTGKTAYDTLGGQ